MPSYLTVSARSDTGTTVVMVVQDGSEVLVERLAPDRAPDLTLVDALMRLQLAARRRGWQVGVRGATDELRGLLELVGLRGVLLLDGERDHAGRAGGAASERRGQPERREELGVDVVVQPADPPV